MPFRHRTPLLVSPIGDRPSVCLGEFEDKKRSVGKAARAAEEQADCRWSSHQAGYRETCLRAQRDATRYTRDSPNPLANRTNPTYSSTKSSCPEAASVAANASLANTVPGGVIGSMRAAWVTLEPK